MIVLGIDPGNTGATAMLGHRGELLHLADLPTMVRAGSAAHVQRQINGAGLAEQLREWLEPYAKNEVRFFLETPIAFPGLHSAAIGASFHAAGLIEGVVTGRGYALELAQPHIWKKAIGLTGVKKESKTDKKERARALAIRCYPEADIHKKKDHNRAEALLIARYGHGKIA